MLLRTKSYVGYVHAVAHSLGGKYGVAHGLANAVLLPKVLREYGKSVSKPLAALAKIVGLAEDGTADELAAERFVSAIEAMEKRMQIPERLSCVEVNDIPEMAKHADREANPLYPVPVLWDSKELERIYYLIIDRNEE